MAKMTLNSKIDTETQQLVGETLKVLKTTQQGENMILAMVSAIYYLGYKVAVEDRAEYDKGNVKPTLESITAFKTEEESMQEYKSVMTKNLQTDGTYKDAKSGGKN